MRIPTEAGRVFRREAGQRSDLKRGGGVTVTAYLQAELVCGIEARWDDIAGVGAVPGAAHERHDGGAGRRPPVAGFPSQGDRRPDPGGGRPEAIAGRYQVQRVPAVPGKPGRRSSMGMHRSVLCRF